MWSAEEKTPYGNLALRVGTGREFIIFFSHRKSIQVCCVRAEGCGS